MEEGNSLKTTTLRYIKAVLLMVLFVGSIIYGLYFYFIAHNFNALLIGTMVLSVGLILWSIVDKRKRKY